MTHLMHFVFQRNRTFVVLKQIIQEATELLSGKIEFGFVHATRGFDI